MKKIIYFLIILVVLVGVVWYGFFRAEKLSAPTILSFEDCVKAGYTIINGTHRQCKTPDGRTYAEEIPEKIVYKNSSADLIVIDMPFPGAVTGKTFKASGKARGNWYFEASFPVKVLDKDGKVIFQAPAQAKGEWMTTEFVPFEIEVKVPNTYIGPATLVFEKDNPSGLPEHEASASFLINIEY